MTAAYATHREFTYTFANSSDAVAFKTAFSHELVNTPTDMNVLQDVVQAKLCRPTFTDAIKRIAFTEPYNVETIHSVVHSYKITSLFSEEKDVLRTFGDEQKHRVILSKKTLNYEVITEALRWCIDNVKRGKWSVKGKKHLCEVGLALPSRLESESVIFSFSQKTTADIFAGKYTELHCCYMDTIQNHSVIVKKNPHSKINDVDFVNEMVEWIEENTNGFWSVRKHCPPNQGYHRQGDGYHFSFSDLQDASFFRLRF